MASDPPVGRVVRHALRYVATRCRRAGRQFIIPLLPFIVLLGFVAIFDLTLGQLIGGDSYTNMFFLVFCIVALIHACIELHRGAQGAWRFVIPPYGEREFTHDGVHYQIDEHRVALVSVASSFIVLGVFLAATRLLFDVLGRAIGGTTDVPGLLPWQVTYLAEAAIEAARMFAPYTLSAQQEVEFVVFWLIMVPAIAIALLAYVGWRRYAALELND